MEETTGGNDGQSPEHEVWEGERQNMGGPEGLTDSPDEGPRPGLPPIGTDGGPSLLGALGNRDEAVDPRRITKAGEAPASGPDLSEDAPLTGQSLDEIAEKIAEEEGVDKKQVEYLEDVRDRVKSGEGINDADHGRLAISLDGMTEEQARDNLSKLGVKPEDQDKIIPLVPRKKEGVEEDSEERAQSIENTIETIDQAKRDVQENPDISDEMKPYVQDQLEVFKEKLGEYSLKAGKTALVILVLTLVTYFSMLATVGKAGGK